MDAATDIAHVGRHPGCYAQSVFSSEVLDFTEGPDDPNEPGHEECLIMSRDRSQLLLSLPSRMARR